MTFERAEEFFRSLQDRICAALSALDGSQFVQDDWKHESSGGGRSRVLEGGRVLEKAGVNFSSVAGELPADFAASLPGSGRAFAATGLSLVLHPQNPHVPTTHMNFRCLRKGEATWFGGGADLTPYFPRREDVEHFHRVWKTACDRHDPRYYPRFKTWCDRYFFLPHRGEMRGVGGIFFDYLGVPPRAGVPAEESPPEVRDLEAIFAFVRDAGDAFLDAWLPLASRRLAEPFGERERAFQLVRRGRYVEFNLLYDRGTLFGLKTRGRVESILMSLPPLVSWPYAGAASPEELALRPWLQPQEWF